jgi:HlyD family secretion protein
MDREIAPEIRTRRIVRRTLMVVAVLAVAAIAFAASIEWMRPSISREDIRTARVERGIVDATIEASGTVIPRVEQVVSSPVEARVLRIGRRPGDRVRAGDELLTLDTSESRLEAERLRQRVEQKTNENAQLRLRVDESVATLEAQLEQKKLDVEILRYTSAQRSKLREAGLIAEQDALAAAASAKKAEIELRQTAEALERAKRSREAQLAAADADANIVRGEAEESRRQLALAMLEAERDGVLTWIVNEEGATIRRGDVLARVADLSAYRIEATVSDIHAAKLAAGMRARVKLDEQTSIHGTVSAVDPRIVNGVVRFYIELDEPAHASLRNNLRADVFIVAESRGSALKAKRGSLGRGESDHLFLVRGEELVRVPVRFGLRGDETIEILEGVREGDEVVISDMTDYQDIDQLRLK